MTATATMIREERAPTRTVEQVLAHAHLRLGSLALAQAELETMAGLGLLDTAGLVDLAEVRWRTGDLPAAGDAAAAAMRAETADPTALIIAAEAAGALGRPTEARRLAGQAMSALASAGGSIDAIFAGMPRSSVWPGDADEPPPTAPTLFDGGPEAAPAASGGGSPAEAGPPPAGPSAPRLPVGPVALGFWDEDEAADRGPVDLPDPARELEAGRAALVGGSYDQAALRFGIALRLAPALASAILEATSGARGPALAIVRGDAYRLLGDESSAQDAFATAARGGALERRKRSRGKVAKGASKSKASATRRVTDKGAGKSKAAGAPDVAVDPEGTGDIAGTAQSDEDTKAADSTEVAVDTEAAGDVVAVGDSENATESANAVEDLGAMEVVVDNDDQGVTTEAVVDTAGDATRAERADDGEAQSTDDTGAGNESDDATASEKTEA